MTIKLTTAKSQKKTTGVYIDIDMLQEIAEIAESNKLSVNETMTQLISLGLEKAKESKAND